MHKEPHPTPWHVKDGVPEDGTYVCVPCGFKKKLKKGEVFGECVSCLKDEGWHQPGEAQDEEDLLSDDTAIEELDHHYHTEDEEEVVEGQELWEKIEKPTSPETKDA